ncbi:NAD-P-binding protein [Dichomitus squalens]|uniref:NAD-P-binding protein n=1 Tax=Dichomitus squalens TaxID=114155 RepID=A0A4Q9MDE7_9APHY|nr:NAD-P-binding protein [Dichomitus squalens]
MSSRKTVVLVTGCSKGGIGFALCEEFAAKGCVVYATARRPESMDGFSHDGVRRLPLDVTKDDDVTKVVQTIIAEEGQIDILVNNAGASTSSPLIDVDMDDIVRIFETNVFATIRTARAVIPHMTSRKRGTIVNVGSVGGNIPNPWNGVYCATKAALHSLTDVLYMECTPFNIHVVLLAPGAVKSNIATNQAVRGIRLPPDSLYQDYYDSILKKMTWSQESNPMPTEVFAQKTVNALLQPKPPRYMSEGTMTSWYKIFEWLPRTWVLDYFWSTLGEGPRKAAQNKK